MLGRANISPKLKQGQRLAMTPSLRQAMSIMAMRIGDVRRFALDLAENPFLEVDLPVLPRQHSLDDEGFDFDRVSHDALHPETLSSFIIRQIDLEFKDPDQRAWALAMVEHLSPAGWLEDTAWPQLSAKGLGDQDFDDLLARLQQLDPQGVFARNLAECLYLQLDDRGLIDQKTKLVLDHLDQLQDGIQTLAEHTGLSLEDIQNQLLKIRQCRPKPGADFIQDEGDIFHPDMTISKTEQGYNVTVNQGLMPSITIKDDLEQDHDDAAALLLEQARADARMLSRTLTRRQDMLLDMGARLIQQQQGFLEHGEAQIMPLSMTSMADDMGMHKATISRLVADKLVETPRGIMMLADFFCPGVAQPHGAMVASRRIINMIRLLILSEDKKAPYSDQDLCQELADQGIIVARRTIAKYRQDAGFLGQSKRRQSDEG